MMPETAPIELEVSDADLARECLYRFLAAVVGGPFGPAWDEILDDANQELALGAVEVLGEDGGPDSTDWARLIDALRDQSEPSRDEFDRVFGLVVPKECPPYETEYYPTVETFARSQQMADIAGFYHAFGIEPSHSWPERPDHLALELEFLAFLLMKRRIALRATDPGSEERAEICEQALRDFVSEHLAWWVPTFAAGLARKAGPTGYHAALARVLTAWIPAECRRLGIASVLRPVRPELIETPEEQTGCASCPLNI